MSTHVVNVAFDFDDDKVRQILEDSAEQRVIDGLKDDCYKAIVKRSYGYGYGNYSKEEAVQRLVTSSVDAFFEDYKEEIIKEAAKMLADRLMRTKAVREATKKILESAT